MLTSLHKDLTTPYKSNSLFFFIKAEAHSLAEELRLCCLCIRYKLARRDGFVGGLSLSYQGQAFILAIAIKAEAHSLAEELRLCCLCIRYKLARRDGFVGGLSLSYQGQAFILAIAMCKANTSRSVNLGTTPLHLDTIPYLLTKLQASCLHIIRIFANIAKRFCIQANTSRSVNLGTTPLHLDTIPYLLTKLQASCLHIIRIFANIAKRFCIQYLLIKSFFTFNLLNINNM